MEELAGSILQTILAGGPQAIIAILLLVIVYQYMENRRLHRELDERDDKIDAVVKDYHAGALSLTAALVEIRSKLKDGPSG
jgi:Flp pilus assembly protein TadB